MADADVRRLELQAAQGDVDAAERLLREQLRRGRVPARKVRLAAYLGHPGAQRLCPLIEPDEDPQVWASGLARWGHEVLVRAALAIARHVAGLARAGAGGDASPLARCLAGVEAWLDDPGDDAARSLAEADRALKESDASGPPANAARAAAEAVLGHDDLLAGRLARGARAEDRRAAEVALLPWALGPEPLRRLPAPPAGLESAVLGGCAGPDRFGDLGVRVGRPLGDPFRFLTRFAAWDLASGREEVLYRVRTIDPVVVSPELRPDGFWLDLRQPGVARVHGMTFLPARPPSPGHLGCLIREEAVAGELLPAWRLRSPPPSASALLIAEVADAFDVVLPRMFSPSLRPENVCVTPSGRPVLVGLPAMDAASGLGADWERTDSGGPRSPSGLKRRGAGASFAYSPPEQLGAGENPLKEPVAVYRLGMVLYELVAGRPAFTPTPARTWLEHALWLRDEHQAGAPPRFAELGVEVDPRLEAVVRRALAKAPPDRQPFPAAFAEELRAAIG
jgi:hypothetical protein